MKKSADARPPNERAALDGAATRKHKRLLAENNSARALSQVNAATTRRARRERELLFEIALWQFVLRPIEFAFWLVAQRIARLRDQLELERRRAAS